MIKKKTVGEYFNFFSRIPEEKWQAGGGHSLEGATCVLGHLTTIKKSWLDGIPYNHELNNTVFDRDQIWKVNDGGYYLEGMSVDCLGDTPKERVLNALILKASGIWDELK